MLAFKPLRINSLVTVLRLLPLTPASAPATSALSVVRSISNLASSFSCSKLRSSISVSCPNCRICKSLAVAALILLASACWL